MNKLKYFGIVAAVLALLAAGCGKTVNVARPNAPRPNNSSGY